MGISGYIREIGRGKEGARSLDRAQARDLMSQLLDGRVTDLEVGAFALAMRIKGESVAELAGFLDAVEERCIGLHTATPTVVLPSYNGSRRLPNLTALLALLLARDGVPVLVHGPAHDAGRVTTAEIFRELDLTCAADGGDVTAAWQRREPVFVHTETLCPPLARLLAVRAVVGLRNSGHTVAKLLPACRGSRVMRVVNYTHPEYGALLGEFLAVTQADAMLMRGTEGEPVADARRQQRIEVIVAGTARPELSLAAQEGVLTELPSLPRGNDAATTARAIRAVMDGESPAPRAVAAQASCLRRALAALSSEALPATTSATVP